MSEIVVGAYAALPTERPAQARFYYELAARRLATGLEIPYVDALHEDVGWFAAQVQGRFRRSVVSAIPGTMKRVRWDPMFGLASPDEYERRAAVEWVNCIRRDVEDFNQRTGEESIAYIQIPSAPSIKASATAFQRSLGELLSAGGYQAELVIEHCDAYSPVKAGEKRFLSLVAELAVADDLDFVINWGRSAIEGRNVAKPREHIEILAEAKRLKGVVFSGVGAQASPWGRAWEDAHLPLSTEEPTSLMTPDRVDECLAAAGEIAYKGVKVQVQAGADRNERLACIESVVRRLRRAEIEQSGWYTFQSAAW